MSSYSTLLVPGITGFLDPDVYNYAQSLAPLLDLRFTERTGTTAINYGTVGTALNGTIGGTTSLGQTGKLGANEAYLYDGLTSFVSVPNHASINALTQFTYVYLINPSSAGEINLGTFSCWGNAGSVPVGASLLFNGGVTSLFARVLNSVDTQFSTTTTTGISTSLWSMVFWQYDDSGDRKSHLFKGVSGVLSEYAYSAQSPLTGTLKTQTPSLFVGNSQDQARSFAGLYDWFLLFNRVLSPAEMTQLTKLVGV